MGNDKKNGSTKKSNQESSKSQLAEFSRRSRQVPQEKSRGLLLPSLFFVFVLIPSTLLVYLLVYHETDDTLTAKTNHQEVLFELNSQPSRSGTVHAAASDDAEDQADIRAKQAEEQKQLKAKARERELKAAEEEKQLAAAKKAEEEKAQAAALAQAEAEEKARVQAEAEKQAQAVALAEQKAREEEEEAKTKLAQQQAEEQKQQQQAQEQQEQAQQETEAAQDAPAAGGKTIVVQSSETLYRIAVNNYGASGAAAAVEKIKQANGLGTNNISPGQTLILP